MSKVGGTRIKTGGRKKGTPNKVSADIQAMMLASLNDGDGGKAYFIEQKRENPTAYMTMISKLLPKQVEAQIEHSGEIFSSVEINIVGTTTKD